MSFTLQPSRVSDVLVDVREETMASIEEYARIPSAFRVDRILRVRADAAVPAQWSLSEEPHAAPFLKNYDAIPGNHPMDWQRQFDTAGWRLFSAFVSEHRVGGAIVIPPTTVSRPAAAKISELLDLRVHAGWRRRGIASALWRHVESVVTTPLLRAETQNVNVAACAFYSAQGCTLLLVEPFAYPMLPDEVRLVWQKAVLHT